MQNAITGKVVSTRRAGTSMMGNPSYDVTIATEAGDIVTLRTSSDSSIAYAITNPEFRDESHTFNLTRAGRITGYVRN